MSSNLASTLLRRTSSIRRPNFSGLRDTIRGSIDSDLTYGSNEYIHKDFFADENYQSMIKCLDGGYEVATDLIEFMKDYSELVIETNNRYTSYTQKWKSKINEQSSLSSYHTTKRAQVQTITAPESLAQLNKSRPDAIKEVITSYKRQVKRMYPSERFGGGHKHYRSHEMEQAFKNAHAPVNKASERLEKIRKEEKKVNATLHDAMVQCQNLELDETSSKTKVAKAQRNKEEKESELKSIKEKITRAEEDYEYERKSYRQKATDIYHQCRELEQERLNLIRDTLIEFIHAVHPDNYSAKQDAIFDDLLSKLESEQNTLTDLDFWGRTYHVISSTKSIPTETQLNENAENENIESQSTTTTTTQKPKKSSKNETSVLRSISENTAQSIAETEEDQTLTDKSTTAAKGKPKKKKNNTAEPTSPDA